ncbi:carboxymuconolactone decarboxylase family protein [Streptomyces sp. WAC 06738]|uniref:carboxymuconolactone decarboxylase family protein n=1 Tax=Streptomyces sp. WAC 06738 TaxID=2203210 RepID=UPI000F7213DD|nr:carboxymuconolactone decarboxylase family protein [Streptomyces sp. WAC 06738]AZM45189.1 carboxymuconolactone decarboxylase family protein [Streptomyces sp. WAC 06738]
MTLRVPRAELPGEMREAMVKQFGASPEPVEVLFNHPDVAVANLEFAAKAASWRAVDASLKSFAHMAVAALVGCSWCLDVGYFQARNEDLDLAKASQVPRWRDSDVFSPLEREVMAYAEAMSVTPAAVTDAQAASLLAQLGSAGLVELTAFVGFVNLSTRANTAHGVTSQGFSESCEIPLAGRAEAAGRA